MKEKQDGILKKNVTRCGGRAQHVAGGKGGNEQSHCSESGSLCHPEQGCAGAGVTLLLRRLRASLSLGLASNPG